MPPKDYHEHNQYNCTCDDLPTEKEESPAEVQNYEVVYDKDGVKTTDIVEADEVQSGDFIEFWHGDKLMLMVRDEHLYRVTNLAMYLRDAK